MSFLLAIIVCIAGVAGLFHFDRDRPLRTSRALWLPVIWLWIVGSRSVSEWLQISFGLTVDQASRDNLKAAP